MPDFNPLVETACCETEAVEVVGSVCYEIAVCVWDQSRLHCWCSIRLAWIVQCDHFWKAKASDPNNNKQTNTARARDAKPLINEQFNSLQSRTQTAIWLIANTDEIECACAIHITEACSRIYRSCQRDR